MVGSWWGHGVPIEHSGICLCRLGVIYIIIIHELRCGLGLRETGERKMLERLGALLYLRSTIKQP